MTRALARFRLGLPFALASTLACGALEAAPPVAIESVSEAPKHFEAARLEFAGIAKPEYLGETTWKVQQSSGRSPGTSYDASMQVVPVVPAGWSPSDPVPLWVTQRTDQELSEWLAALPRLESERVVGKIMDWAGREPGFRTTSGWQKAIRDAEAKHGLVSDPHAPIVMWPDPG